MSPGLLVAISEAVILVSGIWFGWMIGADRRSKRDIARENRLRDDWADAARLLGDAYDFMQECYDAEDCGSWLGGAARHIRIVRRLDAMQEARRA